MGTIGIRIVHAGNNSIPGHMYVVFTGDDGSVQTFGYFPQEGLLNAGGGLGEVRNDDFGDHESRVGAPGINGVPNVARDFPVSASDYQRALDYARDAQSQAGDWTKKWGYYSPFHRSCVDFAWNVAKQAGVEKSRWFEGFPLPQWNTDAVDKSYYEFFRREEFNKEFRRGVNWAPPRDPLILDLDGDGIELSTSDAAVLFDHNADGIKTGSQWAKPDDALLVRDLNGNGSIDSGRELFGDQTLLASGPNAGQTAANGFAALSALDSNADGLMDASDTAYAELKIWRDLNQDGISQAGELQSLSEAGISNINLNASAQGRSTFTQDGLARTAQNVNFTSNNFYREFSDDPAVTPSAAELPQMQGAGLVRDLRQAMSLGTDAAQWVDLPQYQALRAGHSKARTSIQLRTAGNERLDNATKIIAKGAINARARGLKHYKFPSVRHCAGVGHGQRKSGLAGTGVHA